MGFLNNVFELRLDARKLLVQHRRPTAQTLYWMMVSEDGSFAGYVDFTLSKFDPNDMDLEVLPSNAPKFCRYQDYRISYDSPDKYNHSKYFFHIWFARIAFVVIYQNVIAVIMMLLKLGIPDIPSKLKNKMKIENYITKELIIEMERRKEGNTNQERRGP